MKQVFAKKIRNGNIFAQISYPENGRKMVSPYWMSFPVRTSHAILTLRAERPCICREGAVTRESTELFSAFPSVLTQLSVAAAVPSTTRLHSGRHLSSFFQVQGHSVQLQRPNAAQKAPLSGGRST